MKHYIGLDAHTANCTAVVLDEKGEIVQRQNFRTSEGNLKGFVKSIQGEKHLIFEEFHLAQWLYIILKDHVDRLVVCNPVYLSDRPGAKTDFRDALHLARELRSGHFVQVYHDESHWIQLRVLVSGYIDLVREIVRAKNRLKALFKAEAINTDGSKFYTSKDRTKDLSHESARFVSDHLYWNIENLEKQKREFRLAFQRNLKRYKPIRNLTSVPGIDLVRANIIAAIVCMPHRFKNKHSFWGYCMLVRHIEISDGRIYGNRRIHGRSELKDAFIGAAESILRLEGSLRNYYDQLRRKGISHDDARRSVARKIAAICLSILKNSSTFNDHYEEEQKGRIQLRKTLNEAV